MRLRRSSPEEPGLRRSRHGKGFRYVDDRTGSRPSSDDLARARALAIPPAWRDVWICADAHGHLQATGIDDAGRRQYLYHPTWRTKQDEQKFERMRDFAAALPRARRTVARHLRDAHPTRRRALAAAFRILDRACIRVGSEQYARRDGGIGLATLRWRDVDVAGADVRMSFHGKSGIAQRVDVHDQRLADALLAMRPPGQSRSTEVLAYADGDDWRDIRSGDVNDYLREVLHGDFTAKDFRTWHATVAAAAELRSIEPPATKRDASRARAQASQAAAETLGNTPTVARASYIDPRVFDAHERGDIEPAPVPVEEATLQAVSSA